MNTHRLKLYFEDGSVNGKVICPEGGGCEPITTCHECGRSFGDDCEPCDFCPPEGEARCWLSQWAEASDPGEVVEWLRGEVTIEVNGIFENDDYPLIEVYEPQPKVT